MNNKTVQTKSLFKFYLLLFGISIPFWILGAVTEELAKTVPINLPISALMFICPLIVTLILVPRENKKKKLSTYVLVTMFSFTLMGCSANTNPSTDSKNNNASKEINDVANASMEGTNKTSNNNESNSTDTNTNDGYKDGVYGSMVESTKSGFEEAVVTIKDGKIQNVELKRLDKKNKEVNYEQWDGTKWDHPNLKQYRVDLAKAMMNKQSSEVDIISGATESSNGWKTAASEALLKAK
ncbi:FMN-binding protein [Clostridium sp.]|uniref:FMN-binding protein n=1 Tax=Clostridium sp. TaxID=1506 RepID=UPI002FCB14DE